MKETDEMSMSGVEPWLEYINVDKVETEEWPKTLSPSPRPPSPITGPSNRAVLPTSTMDQHASTPMPEPQQELLCVPPLDTIRGEEHLPDNSLSHANCVVPYGHQFSQQNLLETPHPHHHTEMVSMDGMAVMNSSFLPDMGHLDTMDDLADLDNGIYHHPPFPPPPPPSTVFSVSFPPLPQALPQPSSSPTFAPLGPPLHYSGMEHHVGDNPSMVYLHPQQTYLQYPQQAQHHQQLQQHDQRQQAPLCDNDCEHCTGDTAQQGPPYQPLLVRPPPPPPSSRGGWSMSAVTTSIAAPDEMAMMDNRFLQQQYNHHQQQHQALVQQQYGQEQQFRAQQHYAQPPSYLQAQQQHPLLSGTVASPSSSAMTAILPYGAMQDSWHEQQQQHSHASLSPLHPIHHHHYARQAAPSPTSCGSDDDHADVHRGDDSLYAPAVMPSVLQHGQRQRQQQELQDLQQMQHNLSTTSSSFASATAASSMAAWSPAPSEDSFVSAATAATAATAPLALEQLHASQAMDATTAITALARRRSAPSAVGPVRHSVGRQLAAAHRVTKDRRPHAPRTTPTLLSRTLPAWLEQHHGLPPPLHPAARRTLSVMLPVPAPETMVPSTKPLSTASNTSPPPPPSPLLSLDTRMDGLVPGMRGMRGMRGMTDLEGMGTVGIAPSVLCRDGDNISSPPHDGTVSPHDLHVSTPFLMHQADEVEDEDDNALRSGGDNNLLLVPRGSGPSSLHVSSSSRSSSRSSNVLSPRASPSPEQGVQQPAEPPAPVFPKPQTQDMQKRPRVKLPRPPASPQVFDPCPSEATEDWLEGGDGGASPEEEAEPEMEAGLETEADGLAETAGQMADAGNAANGTEAPADDSEALQKQVAERLRQDAFLLQHRRAGLTYREIRRLGGFEEAESTLRGRYRTLTKPKEERVRRPRWDENDDRLLVTAVRRLARGGWPADGDAASLRISWKAVSEFIAEHGGSYRFGNTTCHKRWNLLRQKRLV